jgi:hypothetical protein
MQGTLKLNSNNEVIIAKRMWKWTGCGNVDVDSHAGPSAGKSHHPSLPVTM